MQDGRLKRTRMELAEFLKAKRSGLSPLSLGLPQTGRRRTPGLRREEVAAMAGVGVTWYTWLEQGREINVSSHFLDRIARILNLDDVERRHLFLLAQKRPPVACGRTSHQISDLVRTLLDDLKTRPAYVFNLRWDVVAWNTAASRLFAFDDRRADERNMLWMLFSDDRLSSRVCEWQAQAPLFVASFRRDFVQAPEDDDMIHLVDQLEQKSGFFRDLWHSQSVRGRCQGLRSFEIEGFGPVEFYHSTLIINAEDHLRLALYVASKEQQTHDLFV